MTLFCWLYHTWLDGAHIKVLDLDKRGGEKIKWNKYNKKKERNYSHFQNPSCNVALFYLFIFCHQFRWFSFLPTPRYFELSFLSYYHLYSIFIVTASFF